MDAIDDVSGRVPGAPGSRPSDQAPAGLGGSRFDPSRFEPERYDGKPRWLPKNERRLLRVLLDVVEERMALMSDREQTELLCGCLNVSPVNCAWDEYALAGIIYHSLSHDVANRDRDSRRMAETEGLGAKPD